MLLLVKTLTVSFTFPFRDSERMRGRRRGASIFKLDAHKLSCADYTIVLSRLELPHEPLPLNKHTGFAVQSYAFPANPACVYPAHTISSTRIDSLFEQGKNPVHPFVYITKFRVRYEAVKNDIQ
jgi:hypothetical protein